MARRSFRDIPLPVLIVPLGLVAVLALTWLTLAIISRGPLAGSTKHDFGIIELPRGGRTTLTHTFELTNRKSEPVTIESMRPDCGCLRVLADTPITVPPRGRIDVPITMEFGNPERTVVIHIDLGEAGLQVLRVSARARYTQE